MLYSEEQYRKALKVYEETKSVTITILGYLICRNHPSKSKKQYFAGVRNRTAILKWHLQDGGFANRYQRFFNIG